MVDVFNRMQNLLGTPANDSSWDGFWNELLILPERVDEKQLFRTYSNFTLGFDVMVDSFSEKVWSVSFYRGGADGFENVYGPHVCCKFSFPNGVSFEDSRDVVARKMGKPIKSGSEREPTITSRSVKRITVKPVVWDSFAFQNCRLRFSYFNDKLYRIDLSHLPSD